MNNIYDVPSGPDYHPFIKNGKWTKGRITKLYSNKTNREHIFLSKLSANAFFYFEHAQEVINIRESFPMVGLSNALSVEENNLMDGYVDKATGEHHVLNTTFLLTLSDGSYAARAVKYATDLKKSSVIRLIHLQRRFWKDYHGIDFKIITEKQIDMTVVKNLELIRTSVATKIDEQMVRKTETLISNCENCISFKYLFEKDGIDTTEGMTAFRQLLYYHKLTCNLKIPITINAIVSDIMRLEYESQ